jgi:hypothetical protein
MLKKLILLLFLFVLKNSIHAQKFDIDQEKMNVKFTFPPIVALPEKPNSKFVFPGTLKNTSNPKLVKDMFWGVGIRKVKEANSALNTSLTMIVKTEGVTNFDWKVIDSTYSTGTGVQTSTKQLIKVNFKFPVSVKVSDINKNDFETIIIDGNEKMNIFIAENELLNFKSAWNNQSPVMFYSSKESANYDVQQNSAILSAFVEKKAAQDVVCRRINDVMNSIYYETTIFHQFKYFLVDEKKGFEDFNKAVEELEKALELFKKNPSLIETYKINSENALQMFQKILVEKSERNKQIKFKRALRENSYICLSLLRNFESADKELFLFETENSSKVYGFDEYFKNDFKNIAFRNELSKWESLKKTVTSK